MKKKKRNEIFEGSWCLALDDVRDGISFILKENVIHVDENRKLSSKIKLKKKTE